MIDFSRVLAGPYCTMLLTDLGADRSATAAILRAELGCSDEEIRRLHDEGVISILS